MIGSVFSRVHACPALTASGVHHKVVPFVGVPLRATSFLRVLRYGAVAPQDIQTVRDRL